MHCRENVPEHKVFSKAPLVYSNCFIKEEIYGKVKRFLSHIQNIGWKLPYSTTTGCANYTLLKRCISGGRSPRGQRGEQGEPELQPLPQLPAEPLPALPRPQPPPAPAQPHQVEQRHQARPRSSTTLIELSTNLRGVSQWPLLEPSPC